MDNTDDPGADCTNSLRPREGGLDSRECEMIRQYMLDGSPRKLSKAQRVRVLAMSDDDIRDLLRSPQEKAAPRQLFQRLAVLSALGVMVAALLLKALRPSGRRDLQRATFALDVLSAIVPSRIANEEIGDALEVIHRLKNAKRPRWMIYLKVASTWWWVAVHAILHHIERAFGIVKSAAGLGGGKGDAKK